MTASAQYNDSILDGLVKSRLAPFRSWFDTSPRTEIQALTLARKRSPWGIEGWTRLFTNASSFVQPIP